MPRDRNFKPRAGGHGGAATRQLTEKRTLPPFDDGAGKVVLNNLIEVFQLNIQSLLKLIPLKLPLYVIVGIKLTSKSCPQYLHVVRR